MPDRQRIAPSEIRAVLRDFGRSWIALPMFLFGLNLALYLGALYAALFLPHLWMRILASLLAGFVVSTLFVIGHDACHGSFTRSRVLNELFGRIAFLPSLHALSLWNLGHNRLHHRFTNLRPDDYVYPPYSKGEYDRLAFFQKAFERVYRFPFCHGVFYFWRIWWKKMFFPRTRDVDAPRAIYTIDSVLVAVYLVAFLWFLWWLPQATVGSHLGRLEALLLGFGLPQLVWNFMAGFVTYQHHTHPEVAWFSRKEEWDYVTTQVEETTHVHFPQPVNFLLHYIMEHTAHHAQTSIPLYRLNAAQKKLEEHFRERMVIVEWTLGGYLDAVRRCKLYDYENHYWLDFEGRRTSPCTLGKVADLSKA